MRGSEAGELARSLSRQYKEPRNCEIWITPSFTFLSELGEITADSGIKIGAQNVHWEETGAFTGEISCGMLKDCGATFAIVGHSERRHIFLESDEMIFKRAAAAVKSGLDLVFCVGETLKERESGETERVIERQISRLPEIAKSCASGARLIVAYEPVWAIGTGKVAGSGEIASAHRFIAEHLESRINKAPFILYGGSVTAENIEPILKTANVSGALIGGASTSFEKFSSLIDKVSGSVS